MENDNLQIGLSTKAVHAGERPDPTTRASAPNLVMSTTFIADAEASFSVEASLSVEGFEEDAPYFYTRWSNPTVHQLEQKLAALEGAEACVAFGSGMAAITALFLYYLSQGDHLVMSDIAYAGATELGNDILPKLGIEVTRVNMADLDAVAKAVTPQTKLVYAETPCNPIIRLTDISAVAQIAHSVGAKLAVDSTFATPVATQPIALGADYVIHSLTKYLGGHGDALGGALLGPTELHQGFPEIVEGLGVVLVLRAVLDDLGVVAYRLGLVLLHQRFVALAILGGGAEVLGLEEHPLGFFPVQVGEAESGGGDAGAARLEL